MAFKDIDTDLKVCCSSIMEERAKPSPLTLSPISADPSYPYPNPSGTWCNSSTNSPTMFNTYSRNKSFLSANDFYLSHEGSRRNSPTEECSRTNSPIEECSRTNSPIEECSRTNSPISTTHITSGKEPKNKNSHIFSFSSQKKITSTWNYSRNSSPTDNQKQLQRYFDESINDEMGRRRRGSGIVRIERKYEYDDYIGDDVIFSLQKLKENLYNAERRLSIK